MLEIPFEKRKETFNAIMNSSEGEQRVLNIMRYWNATDIFGLLQLAAYLEGYPEDVKERLMNAAANL